MKLEVPHCGLSDPTLEVAAAIDGFIELIFGELFVSVETLHNGLISVLSVLDVVLELGFAVDHDRGGVKICSVGQANVRKALMPERVQGLHIGFEILN